MFLLENGLTPIIVYIPDHPFLSFFFLMSFIDEKSIVMCYQVDLCTIHICILSNEMYVATTCMVLWEQ